MNPGTVLGWIIVITFGSVIVGLLLAMFFDRRR